MEVAVFTVRQLGSEPPTAKVALTASPLEGIYEYVRPVPRRTLFLNQVYVGFVPPLTPVAVNVTVVPAQILGALGLIVTPGLRFGLIVTPKLLPDPVPHEFIGETEIFPPVEPNFTAIEFVPDPEVTIAPEGRIQL